MSGRRAKRERQRERQAKIEPVRHTALLTPQLIRLGARLLRRIEKPTSQHALTSHSEDLVRPTAPWDGALLWMPLFVPAIVLAGLTEALVGLLGVSGDEARTTGLAVLMTPVGMTVWFAIRGLISGDRGYLRWPDELAGVAIGVALALL